MIESVTWRGTADVEGPVDTVDEATRSWMDARGITDLSDLSPEDLAAFITYLNELPPGVRNSPEFKQLLLSLNALQKGLAADAGKSEEAKLQFQMRFLQTLANATTATGDGLDIAQENAQSAYNSLEVINRWMQDPSSLNGDDIIHLAQHFENLKGLGYSHADFNALGFGELTTQLATLEDLLTDVDGLKSGDPVEWSKAVLAAIEALRASGLSDAHLQSLGLTGESGLEGQIQAGLKAYDEKLAETKNPALAASYLRESMAGLVEARSNALQADDGLTQTQRDFYAQRSEDANDVGKSEQQAQLYMEAPVEELKLPEPGEMTREGLEDYYQELLEYGKTIPPGAQGEPFRKMVMLKLGEISTSLSDMKGDHLTLAQSYGLKIGLLAADTWLMDSAQAYFVGQGNQKVADSFSAKKEAINQLASQIQSFSENLLEEERRVLDKLF